MNKFDSRAFPGSMGMLDITGQSSAPQPFPCEITLFKNGYAGRHTMSSIRRKDDDDGLPIVTLNLEGGPPIALPLDHGGTPIMKNSIEQKLRDACHQQRLVASLKQLGHTVVYVDKPQKSERK